MAHIVWIDKTTYREVIADYSGSSRHAALSLSAWQSEYSGDAGYSSMRSSFPAAVADIVANVTIGKWKTDWSAKYVTPKQTLNLSSNATAGFDGVPEVDADGAATHTVTIKKVDETDTDVTTGSEAIRVMPSAGVTISSTNPSLSSGTVNVTVGPESKPCDVTITAKDPAGTIKTGSVTIRFK